MQKKLEGKLLEKVMASIQKESPKLYRKLIDDPDGEIYICRIDAKSTYSADIPEKMIEFFRGGYLHIGVIDGQKIYLPSVEDFCIIYKLNIDLIDVWTKQYKEMAYAMKIADMIIENVLQNEVLSARNSSGALAVLKARVGGKWRDEKEIKNQTFNIIMGNLGDIQGLSSPVKTPELASAASPIDVEATELVDPKTFDRVVSVETPVDVIGDAIKDTRENVHKRRENDFVKKMNSRSEVVAKKAKRGIMNEINSFLES